jgi:adenosylcobinamide-GDP ribazoletransferase
VTDVSDDADTTVDASDDADTSAGPSDAADAAGAGVSGQTNGVAEPSEDRTAGDEPADRDGEGGASHGPVAAVAGAVGFLSRVPVGTGAAEWEAFRRSPWAFVPAGYLVGLLVGLPFVVPLPASTVALGYLVAVVAVTGINHLDGVADLGDAAVVHGDSEARRGVLTDSQVGVGGTAAVALVVAGLALGAFGLASLPPLQALGTAVAAEVGAKLGMATIACLGRAAFDGLGAQLTRVSGEADLLAPVLVALPAAFLSWPSASGGVALVAGTLVAVVTWQWASGRLGGVNGDVFGAANELGRVAALHAGVIAWTLS